MNKCSDYVPFDLALKTGSTLLTGGIAENSPRVIGFYIVFSINVGLRAGDVLNLRHKDLQGKNAKDKLIIIERKTGKKRKIYLNTNVIRAYELLVQDHIFDPEEFIFMSRKGHYTLRSMNRILKDCFVMPELNISTHSLRKCFGRHLFESYDESDKGLIILNEMFHHNCVATTRVYLGLREEELSEAYKNL